jgi:hypothetical protein
MLKKAPNYVLASPTSSTYPKGTPAVLSSAAALLDSLFEHPALGLVHTGFGTYCRLPDARTAIFQTMGYSVPSSLDRLQL